MTDATTDGPRTLDVDLDAELSKPGGYFEDENHRPDPLSQYGTLDTSDTAGGAHQNIHEISPVFAEARAANLKAAARALDPNDPTPEELVVLPQGQVTVVGTTKTADEGRADVERALQQLAANPIERGAVGPEAQKAAEDTSGSDQNSEEVSDPQDKSGTTRARRAGTSAK